MTSHASPASAQSRVLCTYTALLQLRPDWAGALILSLGLSSDGAALSIAANIAGAVSLAIDNDPAYIREIVRTGAVDFVVHTLDEATRAMKNEVRKRAPLSIALNADPLASLEEAAARGFAPQLFSSFLPFQGKLSEIACGFQALGADLVDFSENFAIQTSIGFRSSESIVAPLIESHFWQLRTYTFEDPASLRTFDHRALTLLPPEDTLRRTWLEVAPRILQRQRPPERSLWLSPAEEEALQ
jgi:urocanate hydratase